MTDINSGWVNNPEAVEEVMAEMAQPYFFQAADVLKASGKGKEAYLYKNFKKLGIAYPSPIQTTVGDCVSHAVSLAGDALAATEIANGERESWVARSANEYFYHVSRVIIGKNRINGDGSINAWAAKGFAEYGSLRRIKYNASDLTEYSPKKSRSWGMSQIPKDLYQIAKVNNIGAFAAIKNFGEAADSLFNNYPIIVASNQGFSSKRDKDGFCAPSGTWGHSMAVLGYKDDERPGVVICNSWPSFLPGANQWELPPSAFFCDAEVFDRMCRFNDTFSLSGFNGFKPKIDARVI
jgi:hypothetical protein